MTFEMFPHRLWLNHVIFAMRTLEPIQDRNPIDQEFQHGSLLSEVENVIQ